MSCNASFRALWLVLMVLLLLAGENESRAANFVVNNSRDDEFASDINLADGLCLDDYSQCTLRAAIEQANANGEADTITFTMAMTVSVEASVGALPPITGWLVIDASSVWDLANNRPGVTLNGGANAFMGLQIEADWCAVYGLQIVNFHNDAIHVKSANNNVGGTLAGQRNVISNNWANGVGISGLNAFNNAVLNNYIGLDTTGATREGNINNGVYISGGAKNNRIGGDTLSAFNYISGNYGHGIYIPDSTSTGNKISGNVIGLPVTGGNDVGNDYDGIRVNYAAQTEIGGGGMPGNIIAKNKWNGIHVFYASQISVQDNAIYQNAGNGMLIEHGFDNDIFSNVISNNTQNGVLVTGSAAIRNQISANSIFGNSLKGIELQDGGNTELPAPVITAAGSMQVSGTAAGGANIVQVYSDKEDEGETYECLCVVSLPSGAWTCAGTITGPHVTAVSFDANDNTSEFSTPFPLDSELLMLLPSILDAAKSKKRIK